MDLLRELPLRKANANEFDYVLANLEYQPPEEEHSDNAEEPPPAVKLARTAVESDNSEDLARHLEGSTGWLRQESADLIHLAVKSKAGRCLEHLLSGQSSVDVDGRNVKNETPLYAAVAEGWLDGVKLLLEAKADIEGVCGKDMTVTHHEQTQSETNRQDVETSAKIPKTVLQLAVCLHDAEILLAILVAARQSSKFKEIVNVLHPASKMTPLLIAVTQNKLEFVELLLKNGADVNILDKDGQSALHWAVMKNSLPIVKAMFEVEREKVKELSKMRCKGRLEGTPLSLAVFLGNLEIVKYLEKTVKASLLDRSNIVCSEAGILGDKKGCNVLHLTSLKSSQDVTDHFTKRLYDHDAVLKGLVGEKTEDGCTPLSFALRKRHIDYAHALLASGADLSTQSGDGKTDMDVMINHLPSAPKFMAEVLDRSIKKHEKKPHVAVNFTVLMPTCCFSNARSGSDSMGNTVSVSAVGNGGLPSRLQTARNDKKRGLKMINRRNGGDQNIAEASSSRDDQEMQPLTQIVRQQSEAVGTNQPGEHVTVDIPNGQSDNDQGVPESSSKVDGSKDVAHNHFGVLKELLKLGKSLNHMKILEHPLVESYLYLHWKKISRPFALLLLLNVVFALLLSISAILAWAAIDNDDSWDENFSATDGNFSLEDFNTKTADFDLNSADHHPQSIYVFLLNIFNVFILMVPLVIYEIQCLWHYDRPWVYWAETALKFICFVSTVCWVVTGSTISIFIAIILAWIQVTVLVLELRQSHGCGRLIIHFVKEVLKYKGLVFGLVTAIVSVYISSGGFPAIIKIDTGTDEADVIWYSTIFSLMILICNITFFFFLLLLAYALKTFSDNYPHKDKVDLMIHQMEFLEVYEKFLLGKKPYSFPCLKNWLQSWVPLEVVKQEYLVYRYDDEVPSDEITSNKTTSGKVPKTTAIFPEELHRDIIMKGLENRENILVQLKTVADAEKKKSDESKVQKRVANDSQRIKNLENIMKQVAVNSSKVNHLEAMMKTWMEHAEDDSNKIKNLEKIMEKMLRQLPKSSETESEF